MKYYTRKKLTYEYINSINTLWGGNKMSRFYCRDEELRKLNKRYENGKFECVVIYGRRRVGKTALINEFCKDKPTIFFSALNTTGKENLEALSKAIMSFEREAVAAHFQGLVNIQMSEQAGTETGYT